MADRTDTGRKRNLAVVVGLCLLAAAAVFCFWMAAAQGAPAAGAAQPAPTQVPVAVPTAPTDWADAIIKILREIGTLIAAILAAYSSYKSNQKGAENRERLERVERELAGHRAASSARFQAISTGVVTPAALRSTGGPDGETTGTGTGAG